MATHGEIKRRSTLKKAGVISAGIIAVVGVALFPLSYHRQSADLPGFWFWLVFGVGGGMLIGLWRWYTPRRPPRNVSAIAFREMAANEQHRWAIELRELNERYAALAIKLDPLLASGRNPDEYFHIEAEADGVRAKISALEARLFKLRAHERKLASTPGDGPVRLDEELTELLRDELFVRYGV